VEVQIKTKKQNKMNKFFNLQVRPTILPSLQTSAFGDGDVLADWFAFDIPNGGNRLLAGSMTTKTADGTKQTHAATVLFAKDIDGVAPGSLGTVNATADGNQFKNHIIGFLGTEEVDGDIVSDLDTITVQRLNEHAPSLKSVRHPNLVLQGEPNTGTLKGFSRIYVGILSADGDPTFASTVQCDGIQAVGTQTLTVKTTSALTNFGAGDVLLDEDDRLLGTVKSVDSATVVTLTGTGLQNATVNNKDVYVQAPMILNLSFER